MQELLEGKIDFIGQQRAETLMRAGLMTATGVSFVIGFGLQSMSTTFMMLGVSLIIVAVGVVPGWGMYRRDGVCWS
ncbi:microsomal signal peptidase subunit, partial [Amanita rubescens]